MPTKKSEKAHAELSASGSERWMNCPGSVEAARNYPPQEDNKYTLEGTKAHLLLELWVTTLINPALSFDLKGYPPSMIEAVKFAVIEINKMWAKGKTGTLQSEKRVSLAHIHPDAFGTLDLRIIEHYGRLYVYDYKHGSGVPVDIRDDNRPSKTYNHNTQLIYYALASAHEFNWDFQDAEIGIIQPRAPHPDGPKRSAVLDIRQLKNYEDLFRKAVDRVYAKEPRRYAGKWCRWCVAKEDCREYKRIANSKAAQAFAGV